VTPDWFEQRNITVRFDPFTIGAVLLMLAVGLFVATRRR
jgi:hypothetical protein